MLTEGVNPELLLPSATSADVDKKNEVYAKMLRVVNI
jgi:hypothetical protein